MTAVAIHPTQRNTPVTTQSPMISRRADMSITSTMIGTAARPFTTAAQYSASMGSKWASVSVDAAKDRNGHHHVKLLGEVHLQRNAVAPVHRASRRISGGPGKNGQASKPVPMIGETEQQECEWTGDGLECARGIGKRCETRAMHVQGCRSRENNKERHAVRHRHADPDSTLIRRRCAPACLGASSRVSCTGSERISSTSCDACQKNR